jgi:cytochrome b6-f complex iron-sulfur subunit
MTDKISRRDFIKRSAAGVVIGSAALSSVNISKLIASSKYASYKKSGDDIVIRLSEDRNSSLNTVGGSVLVNDETMLIRTSQTQFTAVNLICRHKGCTVEKEGEKFVCPCHGSEYTITGKVTQGPAKGDLKVYETIFESDKGIITIKIPQEN